VISSLPIEDLTRFSVLSNQEYVSTEKMMKQRVRQFRSWAGSNGQFPELQAGCCTAVAARQRPAWGGGDGGIDGGFVAACLTTVGTMALAEAVFPVPGRGNYAGFFLDVKRV
jgi:hypothetical protein